MSGLIATFAAESAAIREREGREAAVEKAKRDQREESRRRESISEARRLAMRAVQQMTGRVVFPARWAVEEEDHRMVCRERIEGRVMIAVVVHGRGVESICVSAEGEKVLWRRPNRSDLPPARWPISPGRDWFRRALIELGVI